MTDWAIEGEEISRTAAHEAGHVLVAWLSPSICRVTGVVLRRRGTERIASVKRETHRPQTPFMLWDALVISVAGMAAEAMTHATFHTRNARSDLGGMRTVIAEIRRWYGTLRPPWPEPGTHAAPPFERYFSDGLPDDEAELMRSAYRRARGLILAHRGAYERLRTAMLIELEIDEAGIAAALRLPKS